VLAPKSITIDANKGTQTTTRDNSSWIVTQSGRPASIFVGEEIVDPTWLNNYKLVPTVVVMSGGSVVKVPGSLPDFKWRNVGTYLKVLPTLRDDGIINVEVYPEVSYVDGEGKKQAVKVESVSTSVDVVDGQVIPIGGVIDQHRDFYRDFFNAEFSRTGGGGGLLNITLKATVLKPGERRSALPRTTDPDPNQKFDAKPSSDGIYYDERGENPHNWR